MPNSGKQDDKDVLAYKVYIYAAIYISLVMSSLGIFYNRSSLAEATFFFELHQSSNKGFIRLYYLNLCDSEVVYELSPIGCPSSDCPRDTFVESVQHLTPMKVQKKCLLSDAPFSQISSENNVFSQIILLYLCFDAFCLSFI